MIIMLCRFSAIRDSLGFADDYRSLGTDQLKTLLWIERYGIDWSGRRIRPRLNGSQLSQKIQTLGSESKPLKPSSPDRNDLLKEAKSVDTGEVEKVERAIRVFMNPAPATADETWIQAGLTLTREIESLRKELAMLSGSPLSKTTESDTVSQGDLHPSSTIASSDIREAVAKSIVERREKKKLSIRALAGLAEISHTQLAKIEKAGASVGIDTLFKISRALKTSARSLCSSDSSLISMSKVANLDDLIPFLEEAIAKKAKGRTEQLPIEFQRNLANQHFPSIDTLALVAKRLNINLSAILP